MPPDTAGGLPKPKNIHWVRGYDSTCMDRHDYYGPVTWLLSSTSIWPEYDRMSGILGHCPRPPGPGSAPLGPENSESTVSAARSLRLLMWLTACSVPSPPAKFPRPG